MRKKISLVLYVLLGVVIFYIDRITKAWAIMHAANGITVNQFLSLDLVLNRGVTAGMFQSENPVWFTVLSMIIGVIIIALSLYTLYRWYYGYAVIGELLTIAGATSNLLDRYWFQGVIDFFHVHFLEHSFPIFNFADICIVVGVAIMFFMHMGDDSVL